MIGLLFFINFIIMHYAIATEQNDKFYQIIREYPTLRNPDNSTPKKEIKPSEGTTKADILSVLHDIGSMKEIVEKGREKNNDEDVKRTVSDNVGRTKFEWISNLFKSSDDIKDKEITAENNNITADIGLTDVLLKLVKVLEDLNNNMADFNAGDNPNGFMMIKLPLKGHRSRPKRDIDSHNTIEFKKNVTETANEVNNTSGNFSRNSTDETGSTNGRRNMNAETLSGVKEKLLAYLNESFSEIKIKVEPLNNLKMALGNNNDYKIGYVIANVDALGVNLGKIEKDMELNKNSWDDRTILDVFDKLKVSNDVVTSLLGSLRHFDQSKRHL